MIDFAIMPSFECNLHCWFCMYDCGPSNHQTLDFVKTKAFLAKFDWRRIHGVALYGGEPSINTGLYDRFLALLPPPVSGVERYVITNGSWSMNERSTMRFLEWCLDRRFREIIVSSTPEHVAHQDRSVLTFWAERVSGLWLKPPDQIHAQGRAAGVPGVPTFCKRSCEHDTRNMRLGLKPDGKIVYQNCHGEYHVIQTYDDPFEGMIEQAERTQQDCLRGIIDAAKV